MDADDLGRTKMTKHLLERFPSKLPKSRSSPATLHRPNRIASEPGNERESYSAKDKGSTHSLSMVRMTETFYKKAKSTFV